MDISGVLIGSVIALTATAAAIVMVLVRPATSRRSETQGIRLVALACLAVIAGLTLTALALDVVMDGPPASVPLGFAAGIAIGLTALAVAVIWNRYARATSEAQARPVGTVLGMFVSTFVASAGTSALLLATFLAE